MPKLNLKFNDNNLEDKFWLRPDLSFGNSGKFSIIFPDLSFARYRVYDADGKGVAEGAFNKTPLITFSKWLQGIISLDSGMEAVYQGFDAIDEPYLSYKAINKEMGTFKVFYDDIYSLGKGIKPIDTKISKKELVETLYVGITKRIIECYSGIKRYKSQKLSETELLFDFFDIEIDKYLKEQGVDNIDELVKRARDIIKGDMPKVFEENEKIYFS